MQAYYDSSGYAVYPPRRAFALLLVPALFSGFFIILGFAVLLLSGEFQALFLSLFGLVIFAVVFLTTAAVGFSYRLNDERLVLKNSFKSETIVLKDIASVCLFDQAAAGKFLTAMETPWADATRSRDFSQWKSTLKRNAELLKFMSVPLVTSSTSVGHRNNIVKFKAISSGSYILIETKDARRIMITPADPESLYDALRAGGAAEGDPEEALAEENERAESTEDDRNDRFSKRFVRVYRIVAYSIAAFIVVVAILGLILNPGAASGSKPAEAPVVVAPVQQESATHAYPAERPESGWVDDDTLVVRVDSMYWPNEALPREERVSLMREFGELAAASAFANFVATEYAGNNGIKPADMRWDQGLQALKDWANGLPKKLIHEDLGDRLRFGKFVYEYNSRSLREQARKRFERFR